MLLFHALHPCTSPIGLSPLLSHSIELVSEHLDAKQSGRTLKGNLRHEDNGQWEMDNFQSTCG